MKLATSLERLGTESAFSVLAEAKKLEAQGNPMIHCLLYTSPSPRDATLSRMPSSA